ncbi:hypothetical protein BDW22DRAFT_1431592, partial [Trametopsis cervina]
MASKSGGTSSNLPPVAPVTPARHSRVETLRKSAAQSTPQRASASSTIVTPHKRDNIDPHVKRDMEGFTQFVSVSNWVHAVCGVSPDRLKRWVAYIKEHKYFADPEVVQALTEFCQVKNELLRYQPL